MAQDPEQIARKWKQIKGGVKKLWGRLTDEELLKIMRKRGILGSKIHRKLSDLVR